MLSLEGLYSFWNMTFNPGKQEFSFNDYLIACLDKMDCIGSEIWRLNEETGM